MVTPLGVLVLLITLAVIGRRKGYVRLMTATGGLPIGVLVIVGGQPVPAFYTLGIGVVLATVLVPFITRQTSIYDRSIQRPGAVALVLFVAWSIVVTIISPTLFSGIPVIVARDGLDSQLLAPGSLAYSVSNIAQIAYLVIGVCVIFFLSRSPGSTPGLVGAALATVTLLSLWRYLGLHAGVPFPAGFFDNSTAVRIIESTSSGAVRFRGIFSEPSGLASVSLTSLVYYGMRFQWLRGWNLAFAITIFVAAAFNAIVSTAGTFVAAGLLMLAILALVGIYKFVTGTAKVNPLAALVSLVTIGVGVFFLPALIAIIGSIINGKVGSSSFDSRTGVDQFSYLLTLKTWGIGVGLGANRPSSFLAMLLSCTGIPGAIFFFVAVISIMRRAYAVPAYRATVWALVSVLAGKFISGPNLSDPSALLWVTAGVLARPAWNFASLAREGVPTQPPGQIAEFLKPARR